VGSRHGLVVLEVHSLAAETAGRHLDQAENLQQMDKRQWRL
jgi:hypothetical protein